jgi:chorismate-pyruvate lyase
MNPTVRPPSTMLSVLLLATLISCAPLPPRQATWNDSYPTRVAALALLQTLNAELLSHDSATLTLERWCGAHHLATEPRIVAERLHDAEQPANESQRQELRVTPDEAVRYRHVRLRCGTLVLSEADNWYVPTRLTAEMNRQLDSSDTPFGKVLQSLRFQRHTLSATLLWQPLAAGWEMNTPSPAFHPGCCSIAHC